MLIITGRLVKEGQHGAMPARRHPEARKCWDRQGCPRGDTQACPRFSCRTEVRHGLRGRPTVGEAVASEWGEVRRAAAPGGWLAAVGCCVTFLREPEHGW